MAATMNEVRDMTWPSDSQIAQFQRDGAICVRGALDADQIAVVRAVVERMLADPGPYGQTASKPGAPEFFEDFCNWQRYPELLAVITSSGLAELAGGLMRSPLVRLYHDHVLVKQAGAQQRTPWHQDQPYYNIEGRQNLSAWIPVDPVGRATTLEFVAGSHEGTWYLPTTFLDQEAKWFPRGSMRAVPAIDGERDRHRILGWALEPGDIVLFHMLTLHGDIGTSSRCTTTARTRPRSSTPTVRRSRCSQPKPTRSSPLPNRSDAEPSRAAAVAP
jgi:ectoine hydroxylase-related dioxygenase (phytanoyl-CoA dioxygenase family)